MAAGAAATRALSADPVKAYPHSLQCAPVARVPQVRRPHRERLVRRVRQVRQVRPLRLRPLVGALHLAPYRAGPAKVLPVLPAVRAAAGLVVVVAAAGRST